MGENPSDKTSAVGFRALCHCRRDGLGVSKMSHVIASEFLRMPYEIVLTCSWVFLNSSGCILGIHCLRMCDLRNCNGTAEFCRKDFQRVDYHLFPHCVPSYSATALNFCLHLLKHRFLWFWGQGPLTWEGVQLWKGTHPFHLFLGLLP